MNLYYIWQDENTGEGTYHAAVVVADDVEEARETHPCDDWDRVDKEWESGDSDEELTTESQLEVEEFERRKGQPIDLAGDFNPR